MSHLRILAFMAIVFGTLWWQTDRAQKAEVARKRAALLAAEQEAPAEPTVAGMVGTGVAVGKGMVDGGAAALGLRGAAGAPTAPGEPAELGADGAPQAAVASARMTIGMLAQPRTLVML